MDVASLGSARSDAATYPDAKMADRHVGERCAQGGCVASSCAAGNLSMLADELGANRLAATPDHFAVPSRPRVARERQAEAGRQHNGLINCDFPPRGGQILHDALACREAAFEGDPAGLAQRFARVPRLYFCVHFSCSSAYSTTVDSGFTSRIGASC